MLSEASLIEAPKDDEQVVCGLFAHRILRGHESETPVVPTSEDFIDSEYLFIVMDILRLLLFIVAACRQLTLPWSETTRFLPLETPICSLRF